MRITILLLLALIPATAVTQEFPPIPPSDRVHTLDEIRNFWIHTLRRSPLPPKGNGLHPEQQRSRTAAEARLVNLIHAIRGGDHDIAAQLARLRHNIEAWDRQGNREAAEVDERRLHALCEHLAKLDKLESQRAFYQRMGEELDRVSSLEGEISRLRHDIDVLSRRD